MEKAHTNLCKKKWRYEADITGITLIPQGFNKKSIMKLDLVKLFSMMSQEKKEEYLKGLDVI